MIKKALLVCAVLAAGLGNAETSADPAAPDGLDPFWKSATVYFMMTDRFANGDPSNDQAVPERKPDGSIMRNFMGGDIRGITRKIEEGYFDALGVDVLWTTPLVEQIYGAWDDDWGRSYSFHGYWPKDWTAVDPTYGTEEDMRVMIEAAHRHGIRVLADVIINHTGPKTPVDTAWPDDWIRTRPICQWHSYQQNTQCALATSLTDVRTESDDEVELPAFLIEKWKREGRLDTELAELDTFFDRTGLRRAPKNYIIKWLTDWVRDYGIDGFRVDTAKHIEAEIWQTLKVEASKAFEEWKAAHPGVMPDDREFYMVGEVFNWGVGGFKNAVDGGRAYDYGNRQVDFFDFGFDALINMGFATHAAADMETIFSAYSSALNGGPFEGVGILNYIASHDDQEPYDQDRAESFETALKLMLAPGAVQIYYGDELARPLRVDGAVGDAGLRSFMNWGDIDTAGTALLLRHWQKLGQFRKAHRAVGAGVHRELAAKPYMFSRTLDAANEQDAVLVAIGGPEGDIVLPTYGLFEDGMVLKDYYSGELTKVMDGKVTLAGAQEVVLLGKP